jgi:hypothetical protein
MENDDKNRESEEIERFYQSSPHNTHTNTKLYQTESRRERVKLRTLKRVTNR